MSSSARFASRWNTLFTVCCSSPTSWLITSRPPEWLARKLRSQAIESASRWLVGSSSNMVCAPENRIRASSTRRRCPPDRVLIGWCSTRSRQARGCWRSGPPPPRPRTRRPRPVRPRPARTRPSPCPATSTESSTHLAARRGAAAPRPSPARGPRGSGPWRSHQDHRSAGPAAGSRPRRCGVIVPDAGVASPAKILVSVVLPAPLRPTNPILSPAATWKEACSSNRRAPARTSTSLTTNIGSNSSSPCSTSEDACNLQAAPPASRSRRHPQRTTRSLDVGAVQEVDEPDKSRFDRRGRQRFRGRPVLRVLESPSAPEPGAPICGAVRPWPAGRSASRRNHPYPRLDSADGPPPSLQRSWQ